MEVVVVVVVVVVVAVAVAVVLLLLYVGPGPLLTPSAAVLPLASAALEFCVCLLCRCCLRLPAALLAAASVPCLRCPCSGRLLPPVLWFCLVVWSWSVGRRRLACRLTPRDRDQMAQDGSEGRTSNAGAKAVAG